MRSPLVLTPAIVAASRENAQRSSAQGRVKSDIGGAEHAAIRGRKAKGDS